MPLWNREGRCLMCSQGMPCTHGVGVMNQAEITILYAMLLIGLSRQPHLEIKTKNKNLKKLRT